VGTGPVAPLGTGNVTPSGLTTKSGAAFASPGALSAAVSIRPPSKSMAPARPARNNGRTIKINGVASWTPRASAANASCRSIWPGEGVSHTGDIVPFAVSVKVLLPPAPNCPLVSLSSVPPISITNPTAWFGTKFRLKVTSGTGRCGTISVWFGWLSTLFGVTFEPFSWV